MKNGKQNKSGVKVHWTTEMEEKLIELWQENKCLYDIKSKKHEKWALFYRVHSPPIPCAGSTVAPSHPQSHPNSALCFLCSVNIKISMTCTAYNPQMFIHPWFKQCKLSTVLFWWECENFSSCEICRFDYCQSFYMLPTCHCLHSPWFLIT